MSRSDRRQFDPLKIYMKAEGFSLAHDMLCAAEMPIHRRMLTGTAGVVLSALASELFLKCLISIQTGTTPRGHYLKELFDRLEQPTRKRICAIWDAEVVPRHSATWDTMEKAIGIPVPRDLPTALKLANKAFEKLRYSYEGDIHGVAYLLGDLPTILRRIVLEIHPEWARRRPVVNEFPKDDQAA